MTKIATDIEQSKILAEILPIESADMHYNNVSIKGINYVDGHRAELMEYNRAIKVLSKYTVNPLFEIIPCWSLAALLDAMPPIQELCSSTDHYYRVHCMNLFSEWHDNAIDSCVEMIIKLHNKGLL